MAFNRMTQTKRQRERARQEKREKKAQRRADRSAARKNSGDVPQDDHPQEDQDIAGIVPGPQPVEEP